ncbi:MAG: B12-binding domain-containing radical SAM protein [Candidatus Scalinduaceae bacterium]
MKQIRNLIKKIKNIIKNDCSIKPTIALVSSPINFRGFYANNKNMAVDDLGLGYLYTALKNKGYNVHLFDSIHTDYTAEELTNIILKLNPSYVGFSEPAITINQSLKISRDLKKKMPNLTVVYGDIHASLYNKEILQNEPYVDFVIVGDGDLSFPMLIDALENNQDISTIPGLTYRHNGETKQTPPNFELDLNTLPFPYRSSIVDSRRNDRLTFNIVISRGCLGHCTFCSIASFANKHCKPSEGISRWRSRNAQSIFDEVKQLYEQGARKFWICDDNWIGVRETGLKNALEFSELIIKNKLDVCFSALIRPDSLAPTDKEALLTMKEAGLTMLTIGLEASNKEQLKLFAKPYNIDTAKKVIQLVHECQIAVSIPYIMFFPYSTFDMLRQNIQYLSESNLTQHFDVYPIKLAGFSRMIIEKKLKKDNLVISPTTYSSVGQFRFQDKRIAVLHNLIFSIFNPEIDTAFLVRTTGMEASKQSKNETNIFKIYMNSVKKIGKASANLFNYCINLCESNLKETEINKLAHNASHKWTQVINQEKTFLNETFIKN